MAVGRPELIKQTAGITQKSIYVKNLRTWARVVSLALVMEVTSRDWHVAVEPYLKRWEGAEQ